MNVMVRQGFVRFVLECRERSVWERYNCDEYEEKEGREREENDADWLVADAFRHSYH